MFLDLQIELKQLNAGNMFKTTKTPSVLSLTRQNLDPIRNKYSSNNKCSLGAYEVLRTNKKIKLTILASGSEVNLAIEASHKLAKDKIYSKVISVPCMSFFDKQSKTYKNKILNETKNKISIEAGSSDCWKKYVEKMEKILELMNLVKVHHIKKYINILV